MKKLIYLFLTVLIVACSGDDDSGSSNCLDDDAIAQQYDNASTTYVNNPNRANCEAWIASIELILQCTELSAVERVPLEQVIEANNCSQLPN